MAFFGLESPTSHALLQKGDEEEVWIYEIGTRKLSRKINDATIIKSFLLEDVLAVLLGFFHACPFHLAILSFHYST